ncbi:PAS domain S-box protein [Mucilaginibacter sp.]
MSTNPQLSFLENENIFRTVIEESPTPVGLYVGREMIVQLANNSMLRTWGKDASVIGKTYYEALPELEGQPIFKILDDVFTSGIAYEATEDRVDLVVNGELQTFYFNFTLKPLKNPDGTVWGVINTAANVTELVVTRQKLAASEQRIQFSIDSAEIGTWDIDRLKGTIEWNNRCRELYGFLPGEHPTIRNVRDHVHPDDAERITQSVVEAVDPKSGGDYDDIFRIINIDKKTTWVKCKGKAYFNEDGVCYRFAGTTLDITKEIKLREEQEKLIAIVENSTDVIGIADMNANLTYLNKAGYDLFGFESYDEAFRSSADYYMPKDAKKLYEEAVPVVMEKGQWSGEVNYRHFKTGEPIPVYLNIFRINDPETGEPIGRASTARDLRPEKFARNEQSKLLSLIDHSSDFVSLSDLDGNVSYVNAAGMKMLGIDSSAIFRHNSEYIMPGELDRLRNKVNKALFEKGRWAGNITYRHFQTGEPIPVHGTSMLVYDAATGKPQGRASIARDLRREIADQKALADSEHLLKNITNASPTALWMSDDKGSITYTNQTWEDWTGQTFKETLGDGWTKCIVNEDRQRAGEQFIRDLTARKEYTVDFRIRRKDGGIRWCIATGNPQYDQDGNFKGYIGSCTDITEKIQFDLQIKKTNEELNDQIQQFQFVTGFMPVQLWTANTKGEIDYVNERTLEYFGVPAENIFGPASQNFIHPDDYEACMDVWAKSLATGKPYQVEFRLKDKHNVYKWHLARALPFYSDGEIVKWFGTNTDIDDQKQLQRQKDDFLGIASHELKTPVTSIKAYAQVLGAMLTKEGETKKADMVLRMDAQVNRLTNLIGDLLDVTKINSGRLQFNKTWFNFNQAISETIKDLQHTTTKHELIEDFSETGQVYSDKDRIGQVITNLITNAIKYSPHSDKIIISTKLENEELIVCVQDFGIGIPMDKADKVFEQFYRVSGNKQHTFPGLGLGLYISSEIIKREGGRMWVNSIEGKGSTFCFALPAYDSSNKYESSLIT